MRQQILDALKAKFTGVSEEILGRIADKLAKTTTTAEQVQTAVDGVTFQQVLESYGDSRATEAQKTAVSNYEKKHGIKDGKKIEEQKTPPAAGGAGEQKEDVPAWAQALINSNTQLTERLNKMDADRTTASRRQQLDSIVEKLPENLRKAYQRTSVDNLSDDEFSSLLTDVTTEVEGMVSTINAKGAVFGRPAAAGAGQAGNEQLTEAQIKAINTRTNTGADDQPF